MKVLCFVAAMLTATSSVAQDVRNTSYTTRTGERVLRIESVVPASVDQVWSAFTTTEGMSSWFSREAVVELAFGGVVKLRTGASTSLGDTGAAGMDILNYLEPEVITYKVHLDERFSETIREQDDYLQEIVQLVRVGEKSTKVVASMVGWGTSRIWDDAYAFFAKRNEAAYRRLTMVLSNAGQ